MHIQYRAIINLFVKIKEIKWTDKDGVVWGKDCAFLDEEASKMPTSSQKERYMKCKSKSSCNHFTWFNGMCFLQSKSITVSDASFKEGSVCGVIKGTKARLGMRYRDFFFLLFFKSNIIEL